MTTTSPHESEPPEVRLIVRAGIVALSRVLRNGRADADDLARLAAYVRALERLAEHMENNPGAVGPEAWDNGYEAGYNDGSEDVHNAMTDEP